MYVLKSVSQKVTGLGALIEVWCLATKLHDGCVSTVRWPAVLLKLKLVPRL